MKRSHVSPPTKNILHVVLPISIAMYYRPTIIVLDRPRTIEKAVILTGPVIASPAQRSVAISLDYFTVSIVDDLKTILCSCLIHQALFDKSNNYKSS
jgi:hypothetical protein